MPVRSYPKPTNFDDDVYLPGSKFLASCPKPNSNQWSSHSYWQRSLSDMSDLYLRICSYCSTWIPHSTGVHSIDHFIAKDLDPSLAYIWENFRYVSTRFNSRKGLRTIIDPFNIKLDTLIIDFASLMIHPNPNISDQDLLVLLSDTIEYLKLNDDDDLVNERFYYYQRYLSKKITLDFLQEHCPFIAYEIVRQGLIVK